MYELYGFDTDAYRPSLDTFLSRVHPDDAAEVREKLARAIATGAGWEGDLRVVWPNGEERILYGRSEVDFDADGTPTVVRGTRQDVTELRRDRRGSRRRRTVPSRIREHRRSAWRLSRRTAIFYG